MKPQLTKLELNLEREWRVWSVQIFKDCFKVYLYLKSNNLNYYIPFKYLNRHTVILKSNRHKV